MDTSNYQIYYEAPYASVPNLPEGTYYTTKYYSLTSYTIDSVTGNTTSVTDGDVYIDGSLNHLLSSYTNPRPVKTELTYDSYGNVIEVETYDPGDPLQTEYYRTTYSYTYLDENDLPHLCPMVTEQTAHNGAGSVTVSAYYDPDNGNMLSYTDALGNTTEYEYDIVGRLGEVAYPPASLSDSATTVTIDYDLSNQITTVTDQTGYQVRRLYDALGRESSAEEYIDGAWKTLYTNTYDEMSRLSAVTDALGNTTEYEYDALGRIVKTINPDESFTTVQYFDGSRRIHETDECGNITVSEYSVLGDVTRIYTANMLGTFLINIKYIADYTYDLAGRVKTADHNTGSTIMNYYDAHGRLVRMAEGEPQFFDDRRVIDENYSYWDEWYQEYMYTTLYEVEKYNPYDEWEPYDPWGPDDPVELDSRHYAYEYNLLGSVTKVTDYNCETEPGVYVYTQNIYDGYGRLIEAVDQLGLSEYYVYDAAGRTTGLTDRNGSAFTYDYDNLGRLVSSFCGTEGYEYTYDAAGRVLTQEYDGNIIEYTYTENGLLESKTVDADTLSEKTMSYSYNALGQQVSYSDYFGGIAASTYNSRGWLLSKAGAEYVYNANGTVESASFGDNSQGYTYDNRLQTLTNTIKNSLQTTLYSESNTFNTAGNMTESVTVFADTLSNTKTLAHTYGYDIFGQLTGEQYKQGGVTLYENAFDYDFSGNLTELNDETFGANDKNQLISTVDSSENTTLVYDDNGNLLSRTYREAGAPVYTETYDYDVWGQMVESYVGGLTTTYTYYPDGLRKTKTVNEETTRYYYDGDVVVNETLNGQWSAANVKALGNRIVKRTTEDGENALMYNSRGDVVMILAWEDSAEPVAAYLYLAYGKLYSDLSDFYGKNTLYDPYVFDCPILYAGQYYDHETGLYYLRARYYSPDLCRFISEDPIKDGLNWYAYCAGNPVMFADPSGKSLIGTLLLLLLAGGAAMLAGCSSTTVYDDTPPITINPPEVGFVFAPPIEVHIPDIEPVIEVIPVTMTSVLYGGNSGKLTVGLMDIRRPRGAMRA